MKLCVLYEADVALLQDTQQMSWAASVVHCLVLRLLYSSWFPHVSHRNSQTPASYFQLVCQSCPPTPVFNIIHTSTDLPPIEYKRLHLVSYNSARMKAVQKQRTQKDSIQTIAIFRWNEAFLLPGSSIWKCADTKPHVGSFICTTQSRNGGNWKGIS